MKNYSRTLVKSVSGLTLLVVCAFVFALATVAVQSQSPGSASPETLRQLGLGPNSAVQFGTVNASAVNASAVNAKALEISGTNVVTVTISNTNAVTATNTNATTTVKFLNVKVGDDTLLIPLMSRAEP